MSSFALKLNRRIVIERRDAGQDAIGQPILNWQTVATVWANVRCLNGVETLKAGADVSVSKVSIRIRHRTGIDAGMRITSGAIVYNINAVLPDEESKAFIDLTCEAVK